MKPLSKKAKKRIVGLIIVALYFIIPIVDRFGYPHPAHSHIEYWSWVNFPIIIAVWELLGRAFFFE